MTKLLTFMPLRKFTQGTAFLMVAGSGAMLHAATITPGNLVIYRVGSGGATTLGTGAAAVFLDEYTTSGTLVQSIPVPATGAGAMTAVGNATTEGIVSRSQDGTSLVFTGYRADVGTAALGATLPAAVNRVISTLSTSGVVDTSIGLTDATGVIRSAATTDGSVYYAGTAGSVRYVATPSGSATSTVIDARNSRQVVLSGGVVYASNGSTAITGKVQTYGTLPTGTTVANPIVSLATGDAVNGFVLFDLNDAIAGDDTLYALSTVANTILKYSFDGTTWTANGSVPAAGAANLTGLVSGGTVNLYLTTPTLLLPYTDSTGFNGALTGTVGTSIATAATNTGFRGLGVFPVPEPSITLLGLLGLGMLFRRNRR